mmetsp:Transcript_15289/g.22877  ORF Transcript_15289/g.22877 Transcript_15289/m.22877 type:complete len:264 (+) Transcript_15289:321-1112(+)
MLGNWFTHRLALLGVRSCLFKRTLGNTHRTCCHRRTSSVKCTHCNLETLTWLTKNIFFRNYHIVKAHTTCIGAALTHVDLLATDTHTFPVSLDNKSSKCSTCSLFWISFSQYKHPIGMACIGNPHFVTIQHPFVALFDRIGLDRSHVRSCTRFSHTISHHQWFVNTPTQVLFLLLFVACKNHWHLAERVGLDRCRNTRASPCKCFLDNTTFSGMHAKSTARLWNLNIDETKLVRFFDHIPWVFHALVIFGCNWSNLLFCKLCC